MEGDISDSENRSSDVADLTRDLIQQGKFASAEQLARQAIQGSDLDTRHTSTLYNLAVAQRHQNKNARALRTLKKLQALDPHFARAYQEQGRIYRDQADDVEAFCLKKSQLSFF